MTKEVRRYGVVAAVLDGRMTNGEAAAALGISVRQVKRIKGKVKREGPSGVRHGNRDRPSSRAFPSDLKERVIALANEKYFDFNFSHLSEMLSEQEGIEINRETLRQWLRPSGFGGKVRKQRRHRKRRKRSEKEGQMLFLDGSPHQWFGDEKSTLLLSTDDSTGKPLYGLFQKEEDLDGCFHVSREVFTCFGRPSVYYLDRASQFVTTRHKSDYVAEPTQFQRAMSELGIRLIFANSPQARGRGERINRTFQDRLVAELRLAKITSHEEATKYLNETFIPKYCRLFGVAPEDPEPAWRVLSDADIRNVLCKRYGAKVNYDNTISADGQTLQFFPTKTRLSFAKAQVTVNHWLDGTWHVFHHTAGEVPCRPIPGRVRPESSRHSRLASEARASL
jgi:transposase